MTTFLPLNEDTDGQKAAVGIADWLLDNCIKPRLPTEEANTFWTEFSETFKQQDFIQIFHLLLKYEPQVFQTITLAETPEAKLKALKECEGFFTVLMSILLRFEDEDEIMRSAETLGKALSRDTDTPDLRLRLLMALYNMFQPAFPVRYPVFVSIVQYAAKVERFEVLVPYLSCLEAWMADWNLKPKQRRALHQAIGKNLKKANRGNVAFKHIKEFLKGYQGESESELDKEEVISAAMELCEDAIRLPSLMYYDSILSLDAVRHLQHTPYKKLVELVEILTEGGLPELKAFYEANGKLFQEHDISFDACARKIRLLSLTSLALGKSELSLDLIGETLDVPAGEVESWVVTAIGQGLLDARIDQMRRVVLIKSAMQRQFGRPQWETLKQRLVAWQKNVEQLMSVWESTRQKRGEAIGEMTSGMLANGHGGRDSSSDFRR
ncbi:unnamed protein product [Vitrella brassicaformis CCMP3155]|uniref:Eukaryotic translation initiation factor 3 subunit M n=2 Tax=Vitrella brassicaformis TaxID=1169539 RepID=A0A0G4EM73_VITBC|nr:unnamed protein product [Vitrella brassicaformis CCMP3155]|mmetsp:Transcript_6611/g.19169  ORF Transcript_6611/g.19169 Transcript_6611/m.19169 type:complete len:438 (+) Transcript_6611:113-1426(+)|eukprot:CEL98037.1 unnamed protein product [Vitrella brassicaformis CCMP3155]